ncbi:hypothetical protein FRX31_033515 [Thalictrum thalictroides]|uniref:Uncharacterized protein n=1 Tax=Thalictrum thalictroides TaxID=46969 RepID=A0A7J6UWT0_THATH|nr:hypothetical protein FRX31_033515 [Thalictrum thalictroides]
MYISGADVVPPKRRGRAANGSVKRFKKGNNGQRPRIVIKDGMMTPLSFNIDLHLPHVRKVVDTFLGQRFRDYRHTIHKHYRSFGDDDTNRRKKPFDNVGQEAWISICDWFASEKFQKLGKKNSVNRKENKSNHCSGTKSFMRFRAEKGEMINIQSDPNALIDGVAPTEEVIFEKVLGVRPHYTRGMGHGKMPVLSYVSLNDNHPAVEEFRRSTTEAIRRAEEADRCVEAPERRAEDQN